MLGIRMLGSFEVFVDGVPVQVGGSRARSLLAILALTPGRTVTVHALVERCWGETPLSDPRASLHAAVRRLRVVLGQDAIHTTEYGYALQIPPQHVDAVAFATLLNPVDAATAEELDAALALWRNEPFIGDFCEWLCTVERTRLLELWLSAVERRIDLDLAAGHATILIAELQELVSRHPLREPLWARLLRALHAAGRTAEALERYGEFRARVAEELGVDPGPELRRIFEGLLAGEEPPSHQVPQQLPADLPGFTGRRTVLRQLDKLVLGTPTQTVVLHGQGGVGKTTLAVHWAHLAADEFPDGRFFVNLHGYGPGDPVDAAVVLDDLLRSLGVPIDRIPTATSARTALLRSTLAGRRILMVLDDARDEEQVRPLLPGAGAVVVVTSRSRLRGLTVRDQAEQLTVDHLSEEEARELLGARIGASPSDEELLDELARQCNHLPLALAIAAEQVVRRPGYGLADVVAELRESADRLDTLQSGDDPAADVRATFSWSYRALEPETARFFRYLGLYPAPAFSAEAAAALTAMNLRAATKILRRLADLHLLGEVAPGRYRLHDLLRAFAVEQMQTEDSPADCFTAEARLFDWFVQTTSAAREARGESQWIDQLDQPLPGVVPLTFADYASADTWFDLEGGAVPALVRTAAGHGHPASAARLALLVWTHLLKRGELDEATVLQRIALESARRADVPLLAGAALNQLGATLARTGQFDEAAELLQESIEILAGLGSTEFEAVARGNLGLVRNLQGRSAESAGHYAAAIDLSRQVPGSRSLGALLNNAALTYLALDEPHVAVELAAESLETFRQYADRPADAFALDTLAQAHDALGDHAQAAAYYEEAVGIATAHGYVSGAAGVLIRLGKTHRAAGDRVAARRAWQRAITLIDSMARSRDHEERAELVKLLDGVRSTGA